MSETLTTPPPTVSSAALLLGQIRYQFRLLMRTRRALLSATLFPILLVFALKLTSPHGQTGQYGYLVAGAVVFGVISTSYVTHASGVVAARETGVLKRLRGTPLPAWSYLSGRIAATVLMSLLSAVVALVAAFDLVHLRPSPVAVAEVLAAVAASSLCWAALGTAVSGLIPTSDAAWPTLSLTYLPLMFISDIFFPATDEPRWLYHLAQFLPALPCSQLVQDALAGHIGRFGWPAWVLAAWTAAGIVGSLCWFRWLPSQSRRRTATRKLSK